MHPALVTEGCLISVSRRGAGSGGRGILCIGDAMSWPGGPSRFVPARQPRVTGAPLMVGAGKPVKGVPAPSGSIAVGNKASLPGAMRSKPINTARGTPWVWRTCGVPGCAFSERRPALNDTRQASMSRGVEARGSEHPCLRTRRKLACARDPWRPARPRFYFRGDAQVEMQAAPGACPKIRAAERWLKAV
jgi:hypothetical protein